MAGDAYRLSVNGEEQPVTAKDSMGEHRFIGIGEFRLAINAKIKVSQQRGKRS